MLSIQDVKAAANRISPYIRQTPLVRARCMKETLFPDGESWLKLESLQVTGSFKARGATNKLLSLPREEVQRGIVTASGGNHGLATAYAGWLGKVKTTVFVPENVSPEKARKLETWGARVVVRGRHWHEANREALALADREGLAYFHPFADPVVIAGQGTLGLEILDQTADVDELLVAIGGGGLISGISLTVKALRPSIRVVGVEPTGAPTLYESVRAGRVVELPGITTRVPTLSALKTEPINLEIVQRCVDEIVLVTDEEMQEAARWLWFEMGVAADLSGAASVAALRSGKVRPHGGRTVCALISGAGPDGLA
ncbi:MAG: threonine ammonia-lyase [Candidatus Methylomirabilota bacterium]